MIKNLIKHFYQENRLAKAALLLSLFAFSCADQGCIDADDFGEYESQTIEVSANSAQYSCNYDIAKDLSDSEFQGYGVRDCFISGAKSVTDENGETKTVAADASTPGCDGFADASFRNLCISQCVQDCFTNTGSSATSAEPRWTSTTKRSSTINDGVTITPGAEIVINAIGNISLGDSASYPDIHIQADNFLPHTKSVNWSDFIFDVRANQTLNVNLSGRWSNGTQDFGTGSTGISSSGISANDIKIYNGARRLAAFSIPHPAGYDFDSSASNELDGSKGVPLLPDPSVWKCTYTDKPGPNYATAACESGDYKAAGYSNVNNAATAATFPVTNLSQGATLGTNGGMIRWTGDGVNHDSYDPFSNITCSYDSGLCPGFNANSMPKNSGQIIGDAKNTQVVILSPSTTESYKVSFKNLSSNTGCNSVKIWIKDGVNTDPALGNLLDNGGGPLGKTITISKSWSSEHISLEPNQKIVIDQMSNNCGKVIGVKFNKYQDIEIIQSGLVSFGLLGSGSGSCIVKGRIINPRGSHSDATFNNGAATSGYTADFYEYDNFLSIPSRDPLASVNVPAGGWSSQIFVRKGQKIRFSPESWNETWSPNGSTARCGTGMAMSIAPRPALLCRGKADDTIHNPDCVGDISGSTLIGCQAVANECNDDTDSSNYCPNTNCQQTVSCSKNADLDANPPVYAKSGCTLSKAKDIIKTCTSGDDACEAKKCTYSTGFDETSCSQCSVLKRTHAEYPLRINLPQVDQCYDLENYEGKVANINSSYGFSNDDLANLVKAKGAVKLGSFNGSYGNLSNIYDTKNVDSVTNNELFKTTAPFIFTQGSRLRFFLIDGDDFNSSSIAPITSGITSSYSNNSVAGTKYSGSNGMKIRLSGMLNFSNGQWMEVRLCKENSDTSIDCRDATLADAIQEIKDLRSPAVELSEQPKIIEIEAPNDASEASSLPKITTPYKFDSSGNLTRISGKITNDCTSTNVGSYFYCHTFNYFSDSELKAKTSDGRSRIETDISKLRLTFKIIDPEIPTCKSNTNSTELDGILLTNSFYDSSIESNTNATCSPGSNLGIEESDCQKQFYCANKYSNNSGSYFVRIKVKNPAPGRISSVIGGVIKPIIQVMDGDGADRDCSSTGGSSFDGNKTNNPLYKADKKNDDKICLANETDCKKQYYCKISNSVGQAERVYRAIISDARYKAIVTMCLVVMFTFYGVGTLIGTSELSHAEIINRVIKIGLIYLFIGETGWDWFNSIVVKFFKNSTDYLAFMMASSFDDSPNIAAAIKSGNYYDKSVLFGSVDQVFDLLLSESVWKKISALLFASIFGWLYLIIILGAFLIYILAIANAVFLYLVAQVFMSILFTLGPIFFIFTLFPQTKDMFDNWLKLLIGFSLQQIFLLTTLAFFNMLMYEVIKLSLGYKICWAEVWSINILVHVSLLSGWTIASLPPRTNAQSSVGNIGNPEGIPSLFSILFIWVIATLMNKFITFMTDVANTISGGLSASSLGQGLRTAVAGKLGEVASFAYNRSGMKDIVAAASEKMDSLDDKLFDHGAAADKRRAEKKKMGENKSKMEKAGDKAAKDEEKKMSVMSKEEQKKHLGGLSKEDHLKKIKTDAMKEHGKKELKLSDSDIEAAMDDKNINTGGGNNIIGAATYAIIAANRMRTGTSGKSISQKPVADTTLSDKEKKEVLKETDAKGRANFAENYKSGNVKVSRSTGGSALGFGGDVRRGAVNAASGIVNAASDIVSGKAKENLGKAMSKLGSGISSLGTKEGRQAAMESMKEGGQAAMESMKSDSTKAEEQLVAEGEIDAMATGTSWARTDEDKEKIAQRVELNKAQRGENSKAEPNLNTAAAMSAEIAHLDDLEAIDAEADAFDKEQEAIAEESGEKPKKFDRKSAKKKAGKLNGTFSDRKAEARKSLSKSMPEQKLKALEEDLEVTQEEQKENDAEVNAAQEELSKISEEQSKNNDIPALEEASKKTHSLPKRLVNTEAKKEHAEAIKAKNTLKKLDKEKNAPTAKLNKALNTQKNLGIKANSLNDSISKLKEEVNDDKDKLTPTPTPTPNIELDEGGDHALDSNPSTKNETPTPPPLTPPLTPTPTTPEPKRRTSKELANIKARQQQKKNLPKENIISPDPAPDSTTGKDNNVVTGTEPDVVNSDGEVETTTDAEEPKAEEPKAKEPNLARGFVDVVMEQAVKSTMNKVAAKTQQKPEERKINKEANNTAPAEETLNLISKEGSQDLGANSQETDPKSINPENITIEKATDDKKTKPIGDNE